MMLKVLRNQMKKRGCQMNKRKTMKILGNILYTMVFATIIFTTIVVISTRASGGEPELFGRQIKTVLSGSMEPTFNTGSLIFVKKLENPKNLKAGDVITFQQERDVLVTHRIIDVIKSGDSVMYKTKGDNNEHEDTAPVLSENVVAFYTGMTIPLLGYLLSYAGTPIGTAILLIIPGLILIGYSVITIRKAIKEIEGKTRTAPPSIEKSV